MCTTAEFLEKSPMIQHVLLTVFLTEQSHGSGLLSLFDGIYLCNRKSFEPGSSHLRYLQPSAVLLQSWLRNVRSQNEVSRHYSRTCLLYMSTKYHLECFLKQMCCTVVVLASALFSLSTFRVTLSPL